MRYVVQTIFAAALLLGIVALVTYEIDAQNQPDPSTSMRRCTDPADRRCDWDSNDSRSDESAERTIIVYDRSPERRPGEDHARYRDRRYFVERFESFLEEAHPSNWQKERLLLALYDYQEVESALVKSVRGKLADPTYLGSVCPPDTGVAKARGVHYLELQAGIDKILTLKQRTIWQDHCSRCHSRLGWYHDDHILKLERVRAR